MDIASASMQMSMVHLQMNASYAVAGKAMDTAEIQADGLIEMLEEAIPPSFGQRMDIRV